MDTLRVLSWNVNGIRAVHKKGAMDWFLAEQPGILCIQETKAQEEQVPDQLRDPDDYHVYFSSAERKGYSGVAVYSQPQPIKIERDIGIEQFDREGRVLMADYGWFCLFNVYFPNGKASAERLQYKMDFYEAFLDHVQTLRSRQPNIVICGDVNTAHKPIDLARPKENEKISGFLPQERAWIDKFLGLGYVDTFRMFNQEPAQYTWWSMRSGARERNVGWRIDYFYVTEEFKDQVKSAFILPEIMGSDHCPLGIEIALPE